MATKNNYSGITSYTKFNLAIKNAEGRTLDVGCSDGILTSLIDNCIGVDIDRNRIKSAKEKNPNCASRIRCADVENLPFKDREFDTVICLGTLEHIKNTERGINELVRVMRKRLIISFPTVGYAECHPEFLREKDVSDMLKKHGLHLIKKTYIPNIVILNVGILTKLLRKKSLDRETFKLNKKWYFPLYLFLRPLLLGIFMSLARIQKINVMLIWERRKQMGEGKANCYGRDHEEGIMGGIFAVMLFIGVCVFYIFFSLLNFTGIGYLLRKLERREKRRVIQQKIG